VRAGGEQETVKLSWSLMCSPAALRGLALRAASPARRPALRPAELERAQSFASRKLTLRIASDAKP
jgi:hypothetical protein